MRPIFRKWKSNIYLGGGTGVLWVPKGDGSGDMERGILFDIIGGINIKAFWKIGLYGAGKYIYSSNSTNNVKVIDFSNVGALVGISLNFGW